MVGNTIAWPGTSGDNLTAFTAGQTARSAPVTEQVLPVSVVRNTRTYIRRIVEQANGCYEHEWFDACSVMIRKLIETLIIELYEAKGTSANLKNKGGDFKALGDLIETVLGDSAFNLGRETKRALPEIKTLGDRAAHTRHYLTKQGDIDKVLHGFRVTVDELLHLTNLK
jgi:hypothetical protein